MAMPPRYRATVDTSAAPLVVDTFACVGYHRVPSPDGPSCTVAAPAIDTTEVPACARMVRIGRSYTSTGGRGMRRGANDDRNAAARPDPASGWKPYRGMAYGSVNDQPTFAVSVAFRLVIVNPVPAVRADTHGSASGAPPDCGVSSTIDAAVIRAAATVTVPSARVARPARPVSDWNPARSHPGTDAISDLCPPVGVALRVHQQEPVSVRSRQTVASVHQESARHGHALGAVHLRPRHYIPDLIGVGGVVRQVGPVEHRQDWLAHLAHSHHFPANRACVRAAAAGDRE